MNSLLESIIFSSPAGVLIVNKLGKILFANEYAEQCFKAPKGRLETLSLEALIEGKHKVIHRGHVTEFFNKFQPHLMEKGRVVSGLTLQGDEVKLEIGLTPIEYDNEPVALVTFVDVTDSTEIGKLKKTNEELAVLANYDALTNLPNRQFFLKLTNKLLKTAARNNQFIALAFIDLNNFKEINDTLGHIVGDDTIKAVGRAIKQYHRKTDVSCRYGGDEFLIYFHDIKSEESGKSILMQLEKDIANINFEPVNIQVSASIGMVVTKVNESTLLEELINNADKVMYEVKNTAEQKNKVLYLAG